jgi:hypothetical protein
LDWFRVVDNDHLLVDLPLWRYALPGFLFRRVDDSN